MEMPAAVDRFRPVARPSDSEPADDLVVAQRRMRHLAPLDIKPLPMMHRVAGPSDESRPPEERERTRELALYVLAVHMWQAAARSAMS